MRRADRLFDIIQILRACTRPITALEIAQQLEVTTRTIYRDIAALQASRIPIEGAAGVGYVMRAGYDLPPLMFNEEEMEALVIGLAMLSRTSDKGLHGAAKSIMDKVNTSFSSNSVSRSTTSGKSFSGKKAFFVSKYGPRESAVVSLPEVRKAIRQQFKLKITYQDADGNHTQRIIWPLAIGYFIECEMIGAWCEHRNDYRNFRIDRVTEIENLDIIFSGNHQKFLDSWLSKQE